jgi:two-component system, LytTR family, response regulator
MLRTIIIDDEEHQRQTIEGLVKLYCKNLRVVARCGSVAAGVKAIKKHRPDLVLLDIMMDDGTGFDLLDRLSPVDFKVIFITAYNQFAIKAIRFSALDYLLKPVDPDELVQAVAKAETHVQEEFNAQFSNLKENLNPDTKAGIKIILKTHDNIYLVPVNDILYCESDDNYTRFHLLNKQEIFVSTTLKEYEDMLADSGFLRVHKSYLVNLKYFWRFEKAEGGFVVLEGDVKIPVASRKREELLEMLDRLTIV